MAKIWVHIEFLHDFLYQEIETKMCCQQAQDK
jgi:hypothetical protein